MHVGDDDGLRAPSSDAADLPLILGGDALLIDGQTRSRTGASHELQHSRLMDYVSFEWLALLAVLTTSGTIGLLLTSAPRVVVVTFTLPTLFVAWRFLRSRSFSNLMSAVATLVCGVLLLLCAQYGRCEDNADRCRLASAQVCDVLNREYYAQQFRMVPCACM